MHQQKFLVILFFLGFREIEKMSKMKLLSSFQFATQILTFQSIKANFVYEVSKIIRR